VAIANGDIALRTARASGPGLSGAGASPSVGTFVSTTEIGNSSPGLNELFDDVAASETAGGAFTDYRVFFLHNEHDTNDAIDTLFWIDGDPAGGAAITFWVDTVAASAENSASAQATANSESSPPTGSPTFNAANDVGSALAVGDIPPNSVKAIHMRRVVAQGAAAAAENVNWKIRLETGP
jgi:hypothetical protein